MTFVGLLASRVTPDRLLHLHLFQCRPVQLTPAFARTVETLDDVLHRQIEQTFRIAQIGDCTQDLCCSTTCCLAGSDGLRLLSDLWQQCERWRVAIHVEDFLQRIAQVDTRFSQPDGVDMGAE